MKLDSESNHMYTVHKKISTPRTCRVIRLFKTISQNKFIICL